MSRVVATYQEVNQRFADKVLETAHECDLVWVHDYQLMLLPALLKEAAPHLRVGFFLHTPFPVYEIFRCHPRAGELVAGMLGGRSNWLPYVRLPAPFQRHPCNGYYALTHIHTEGHWTALGVYPIGIQRS